MGILGILGIFSGNQAIMRVCEFLVLGILWGCPRGTGMSVMSGMRCLMRAKAHLVTICHRPWEWPFFRVFGGPRRFDGFPFDWRRKAPKRAVLGPYPWAHRIDRCGAHEGYLARGNPGFRREAHSTRRHKSRIILRRAQRRLFPRFGPASLHNNFYGT